MCEYLLMLTGMLMVHYGIYHWPEDKKISKDIIIDAEWEEYDPKENKIDTYV